MEGGPPAHPSIGPDKTYLGGGDAGPFSPTQSYGGGFGSGGLGSTTGCLSRTFTESMRKRSVKVPKEGTFMTIKSVLDIYKQVRFTVSFVANVWGWTNTTTTQFRLAMPGLAKVYVAL
jgi:hypothetical protein